MGKMSRKIACPTALRLVLGKSTSNIPSPAVYQSCDEPGLLLKKRKSLSTN